VKFGKIDDIRLLTNWYYYRTVLIVDEGDGIDCGGIVNCCYCCCYCWCYLLLLLLLIVYYWTNWWRWLLVLMQYCYWQWPLLIIGIDDSSFVQTRYCYCSLLLLLLLVTDIGGVGLLLPTLFILCSQCVNGVAKAGIIVNEKGGVVWRCGSQYRWQRRRMTYRKAYQ